MASYFYTISSLPMLHFNAPLLLTYEEFLSAAYSFATEKDIAYIENISSNGTLKQEVPHPFFTSYATFNSMLTSELHAARMASHADEGSHKSRLVTGEIREVVKRAVSQENPLEAEISLLRLQYNQIEQLKEGHYYDSISLYAYALQLRILERKNRFIPIDGNTEFKRLFTNLQSIIKSI